MRFAMCSALALGLLLGVSASNAATFVVTSPANDSDALLTDDLCDIGTGACTLRAAIEQANATPGADRVEFDIAGGPHTIAIGTGPAIDEELEIDATTQPGSSVNSSATGTNAVFGISLAGDVQLYAAAPNVVIRGLSIRGTPTASPCVLFGPMSTGSRFFGNSVSGCDVGIHVDGNAVRIGGEPGAFAASRNLIGNNHWGIVIAGSNNFVVDNAIGTNASGTGPFGNTGPGIELQGSGNAVTDNVIAANTWGLTIYGDANTLVRNRIGRSSSLGLGNDVGVLIAAGSANQIGRASASLAYANEIGGNVTGLQIVAPSGGNFVEGNRIGRLISNAGVALQIQSSSGNTVSTNEINNNGAGIQIVELPTTAAIDNAIRANRIWGNQGYSLQLANGIGSPHDDAQFGLPPDFDEGANHLQNPPHLTGVSIVQGQTTITGNIDAQAGSYTLDFFSNPSCPNATQRDGEFYLGAAPLNATGTAQVPNTSFSIVLPVTAQGSGFTATATDADGNTSEFSSCVFAAFAGGADLVLTATLSTPGDPLALNPGDAIGFSLRIENRGPFVATGIPVRVSTPPGFLSTWIPDPANASRFDAATTTWTLPSLAVGGVALLDLEAAVEPVAAGRFSIEAEALRGLIQYDPNGVDNFVTRAAFARSGADLVVSQLAPTSAQDDDVVSFDVTVTNDGPEDALGVRVQGQLDAGLAFEGASSPGLQAIENVSTGKWTWTWTPGALANGASATVRVDARVRAAFAPDNGLEQIVSAVAASPAYPLPFLSTRVVGLGGTADVQVVSVEPFSNVRVNSPNPVGTRTPIPFAFRVAIRNDGPDALGSLVVRIDNCSERLVYVPYANGTTRPIASGQPLCPGEGEPAIACPLVCRLSPGALGRTDLYFERVRIVGGAERVTARVEPLAGTSYFDPRPSNDSRTWVGGGGGGGATQELCGLIGIECPLILGLARLLRRRKGRTALRRMFPGAALALTMLLGGSARSVQAAQLTLVVDSSASNATVAITSSLGSPPPVAIALSGNVDADVALGSDALFGLVAEGLQLTGGAVALSNSSIVLESFPLYDLTFAWNGIAASAAGPAASGFAVAPGLSLFDLVGSSLAFGAGTIDATGTFFGLPVHETLDLATLPFGSTFPANSIAQLEVTDLGGGVAALRLTLPFSADLRLTVGSEPVTVTIAGTLVLAGQSVPEANIALLLGAAWVLGLAIWSGGTRSRSAAGSVLRTDDIGG